MPRIERPTNINPVSPIRGGRMKVRTFADGYFGTGNTGERRQTIDRVVTVTMPAIDGERHKIVPHMEARW